MARLATLAIDRLVLSTVFTAVRGRSGDLGRVAGAATVAGAAAVLAGTQRRLTANRQLPAGAAAQAAAIQFHSNSA